MLLPIKLEKHTGNLLIRIHIEINRPISFCTKPSHCIWKSAFKKCRYINIIHLHFLKGLTCSSKPTTSIVTQARNPKWPHISLEPKVVPYNITIKFLGLHINENLKWNDHIKHLWTKLSTSYYMIASLQKITNQDTLWTVYFGCFHTILRYGLKLWGGDRRV